ncbi:MAG: biopolymer transporter ExbD [Spirochaetaceae bacterium]|nr:biopolymer transporter ExbD [Spirochaetaceae bacterium]
MNNKLKSSLKTQLSLPLAPLLDIIFIVLFFLLMNARPAEYNSFQFGDEAVNTSQSIIVNIDDEIKIDNQVVLLEDFTGKLQQLTVDGGPAQLILVASPEVSYGRLINIINLISQTGHIYNISLAIEELAAN